MISPRALGYLHYDLIWSDLAMIPRSMIIISMLARLLNY